MCRLDCNEGMKNFFAEHRFAPCPAVDILGQITSTAATAWKYTHCLPTEMEDKRGGVKSILCNQHLPCCNPLLSKVVYVALLLQLWAGSRGGAKIFADWVWHSSWIGDFFSCLKPFHTHNPSLRDKYLSKRYPSPFICKLTYVFIKWHTTATSWYMILNRDTKVFVLKGLNRHARKQQVIVWT